VTPFDGAFWQDPYPTCAALRAEEAVRTVRRADGEVWLVPGPSGRRMRPAGPRCRFHRPPHAPGRGTGHTCEIAGPYGSAS
jgi:hypothetical protein